MPCRWFTLEVADKGKEASERSCVDSESERMLLWREEDESRTKQYEKSAQDHPTLPADG
jgi:hypothetical protein